MKKLLIGLALSLMVLTFLRSEKGHWLPMRLSELNEFALQKRGLQMSVQEIYHPDQSSLTDAIVRFGHGCSGSFISQEGLVLTNYHCADAYDYRAHDSLRIFEKGYWTYHRSQEIPVDGLEVRVLSSVDDLSTTIRDRLERCINSEDRSDTIEQIHSEYDSEDQQLISYYNDQYWYLMHYTVYKDVRLVALPSSDIGRFGGETDNFEWPRHSADFALFRVYADSAGAPADYHVDNSPLSPKHFLPVSLDGLKDSDFCMSLGYPGSSNRYLGAAACQHEILSEQHVFFEDEVKIQALLSVIDDDDYSERAQKNKARLTSCYNDLKRAKGIVEMAKRHKIVQHKDSIEQAFQRYYANDPKYRNVVAAMNEYYQTYGDERLINDMELRSFAYNDLAEVAFRLFLGEYPQANLLESVLAPEAPKYYREYISRMLTNYITLNNSLPSPIASLYKESKKNTIPDFVDHLISKSILFNQKKLTRLLDKIEHQTIKDSEIDKLHKDPLIWFHVSMVFRYQAFSEKSEVLEAKLEHAQGLFMEGLMKMNPTEALAPDADQTLRISYGTVSGYEKDPGQLCLSQTNLSGLMEKSLYTSPDYSAPELLKDLYTRKDYGIYGENGTLYTGFIATIDGAPGSSGSPVVNARGELIGLLFDTNYEGLAGYLSYLPEKQRAICADIRYVLFVIDKYAGAKNLIEEMTFHAR